MWGGVDGLPEALDGLEACSSQGGPGTEALSGAVVDDDEDGGVALGGEASGGVDGPHPVGGLGRDGAIVGIRPADADRPVAGEEAVLPHDPEDASHGGADAALVAEPRPDLAVSLVTQGPTKRAEPSTARISARSSPSSRKPLGPRLAWVVGPFSIAALNRCTVAREIRHARQTRWMP